MNRVLHATSLVLVLACGLLTSCGGDDDSEDSTGGTPSGGADTAGSSSSETVVETSTFSIPLSVTAAGGFEVVADSEKEFAIERPEGGDKPAAYLAFFIPTGVYNPETAAKEGLPPDLAQWLAANGNLEVLADAEAVEIDAKAGTRLDARGAQQGAPALLLTLPGDSDYHLAPLEPARFVILNISGTQLVIAGGAFNRALFEDVKAELEAMIASIEFR